MNSTYYRLKQILPHEFPGTIIDEDGTFRYSPPGHLHGECWIQVIPRGYNDITVQVIDITLENPVLCAWSPYSLVDRQWTHVQDEGLVRSLKETLISIQKMDLFGDKESNNLYIHTKLVQATSCEKFFWLLDHVYGGLIDGLSDSFAWALAQSKGGEILRVMKNRKAAEKLA